MGLPADQEHLEAARAERKDSVSFVGAGGRHRAPVTRTGPHQ